MKHILSFLAGALLGAMGLFVYLSQVGYDLRASAPATVVTAPVAVPLTPAAIPAGPAAPAGPASTAVAQPPPVISADLNETDLPLRPPPPPLTAPVPVLAPSTKLLLPVEGVKYSQLSDNFDQPRGAERHHEALDIMAPAGAKVYAVSDGKVAKLFNSKPGGLTIYQFDPTEKFAYYYAHLERYADNLKEGATIKRGELIGYVGSTGNASPAAPHLHFAVVALTPEKQWWKGTPINPYPLIAE
ncbi:MAG: M23 family metallopeptidase [Pseudomonadota bacterium]